MLGESSLTFLLDHSDIFSSWFETDGPMDFVIYALSSIQVPLNLFMILILVLYPKNSNPNYNSFIFITNLAVTDIIGLILIISSVFIQQNVWSHQNNYAKFNPIAFEEKMKFGCRIQMGLLTFSYLNTVLATMFLTLDRSIFICRPLKYKLLVTTGRI